MHKMGNVMELRLVFFDPNWNKIPLSCNNYTNWNFLKLCVRPPPKIASRAGLWQSSVLLVEKESSPSIKHLLNTCPMWGPSSQPWLFAHTLANSLLLLKPHSESSLRHSTLCRHQWVPSRTHTTRCHQSQHTKDMSETESAVTIASHSLLWPEQPEETQQWNHDSERQVFPTWMWLHIPRKGVN